MKRIFSSNVEGLINLLIFSADGASDPCIYGLDKKNGNVLWKTTRTSKTKKNFSFLYSISRV